MISKVIVSPAAGYGIFTQTAAGRCQVPAGRTTDAGARFGALAPVTTVGRAGPAWFPAIASRQGARQRGPSFG